MLNTPLFFQLVTHFCMQACNPTHMSKLEADLATTKVRRVSVMLKPIELSKSQYCTHFCCTTAVRLSYEI